MEKTNMKALLKRKEKQAGETDKPRKEGKKKNRLKLIIAMLILAAVVVVVVLQRRQTARTAATEANAVNTATMETRDIVSELSSSGTLSAKDSYSIAALTEREVTNANFEEGDQVEKGQILYEIDRVSVESQLSNAKNFLGRSQKGYKKAAQEYNEVLSGYNDNTYKTTEIDYISELNISAGSKVSNNTTIAKFYNDDVMEIRILFLSGEAALIAPRTGVVLTLVDTGKQVAGTVTVVASQGVALAGGHMACNVTIQATNPGGLTTSTGTTAQIGKFMGSENSAFMATIDTTMNVELPATVEVTPLLVGRGDCVTVGALVPLMATEVVEDLTKTYSNAMENVEKKVEGTQSSLDNIQDAYSGYTITTPISDQMVTESYKAGDNISGNTSSTATAVTTYGLSGLTSEISIDELDILSVKVGQKMTVTVGALEGETYTDAMINVSLESTYSNGVTTYSAIVTVDEVGDLLPGVNVDGVITLDEAAGVLVVPSDALTRGNQVYVEGDTVTQQAGPVPVGLRAVKAEAGLVSDSYMEIKSELSKGDVVHVAETNISNTSVFMMDMGGDPGGGDGQGSRGGQDGPGDGGGQGDSSR